MKTYRKRDFPVADVRRFLEPGPVLLVSSAHHGEVDIMAMGWHTVMEFNPSLLGCVISRGNHSHALVRKSGECVLNLPTADLATIVVGIGNCSGTDTDKFEAFSLTAAPAEHVRAPLIEQCFASFECRVHDSRMVKRYDFFVLEVLKEHVATTPKYPETLHYRGKGIFMLSGHQRRLASVV